MNRIRCFLALTLSVVVTRKIADEIERQRKTLRGGDGKDKVAWVKPANLHLTLRFLGSIDEALVDGIVLKLKKLAPRHPPFEARAHGLGAFPDLNRPKVLWVGVDGEAVGKLQREVEAAMVELGFGPGDVERPFHPHITVGRVRESEALPEWADQAEFGASTVNEIVVYESRTHSSGAEYVARARVALGTNG
jgi:2'-5' RNA ligase